MAQALFEVRDSPINGLGAFAVRSIPAGTRIVEYTGEIITPKEADRRAAVKDNDAHTFFYTLNKRKIVDAGVGGNESRFINHSCDPNCEGEIERGHIYIDAIRDIAPGEELTYDYHLYLDRPLRKGERALFTCRCGSAKCRGTILDPKLHPQRKRKQTKTTSKKQS